MKFNLERIKVSQLQWKKLRCLFRHCRRKLMQKHDLIYFYFQFNRKHLNAPKALPLLYAKTSLTTEGFKIDSNYRLSPS